MKDIITQKFNYAVITPYKDYCKLSDRKRLEKTFTDNLDLFDEEDNDVFLMKSHMKDMSKKQTGKIFTLPIKKKKKLNYFYSNNEINERFSLEYLYNNPSNGIPQFETTKQNQIKRHYGREFSEISLFTIERSVRLHGDKLTIKLYTQTKTRRFNCIYFRKKFNVQSLTFNLKTGNFVTLNMSKTGKTNSRDFRTNSFNMLRKLIAGNSFLSLKNFIPKNSRIYNEYSKIFDDTIFNEKIKESLGIGIGNEQYSMKPDSFVRDIIQKFIEVKKIKVPNGDVEFILTNFYPTEKYLKKNDRKLLASVLDLIGIKTKYTIKLLHQYPNLNLIGLIKLCHYFGSDYSKYISNLNPIVFENSYIKNTNTIDSENNKFMALNVITNITRYYLTDVEKENLIRIANDQSYHTESILSQRFMQLVEDHLRMIDTIREYDSSVYMKAKTREEFNNEHRELTKIQTAINKGWVIEYKFSEKMVEDVEKPIPLKINLGTKDNPSYGEDLGISFYPVILKREEDYIEEGNFMHHCVATYADKDRSIIISVRTKDEMDRVTCEYNCQDGRLLQARHFCNKQPPADIEHAISDLNKKVQKYARLGLLHASEKIKVPLKINGVEVQKKEPTRIAEMWNQFGFLN
jgi:hypothetical protein